MSEYQEQIRAFMKYLELLQELGLVADTNPPRPERLGDRRIRLASPPRGGLSTPQTLLGTLRERIALEESGAFSVRLVDDALIQLLWEYQSDRLTKHSYAFLPSPIGPPKSLMEDTLNLADRLGSFVDEVADRLRLGGAFRVDFDEAAAGPEHPTTHFTLFGPGLEEGRLPVKGPWCLGRFFHFVFGHMAPPIHVSDGRRAIRRDIRNAIIEKIPLSADLRTIDFDHDLGPWIAWGRTG